MRKDILKNASSWDIYEPAWRIDGKILITKRGHLYSVEVAGIKDAEKKKNFYFKNLQCC